MIYPISNTETINPSEKNLCILLNGCITIEIKGKIQSIPTKSYFFFDDSFTIVASSPYLEAYVAKINDSFLTNFSDVREMNSRVNSYFEVKPIKNFESKENKIESILNQTENLRLKDSYVHIFWSEMLSDFFNTQVKQSITQQFSNLIEQNIEQNFCAGTYAEMLEIPLKTLIKEVKMNENKTPCNFITEKVIEKAKYKLLNSNDSSQMIAYQLGFEDPYYFIKYFKKNTEITPTQYRAKFSDAGE